MLKNLLKIAFIVLLALAVAELGRSDPGYILINFHGYIIETSVLVLVIFAVILGIISAVILNLIKPVWSWLKPVAYTKQQDKTAYMLTQGMLNLADGDWKKAQKLLSKVSSRSPLNLIATIGQARAAYEQGQLDKAFSYLESARKIDIKNGDKNRHHICFIESQFAMHSGDYAGALRALNKVSANQQTGIFWKLKARILKAQNEWHQIYSILPQIRQDKLLSDEELIALESQCYTAMTDGQSLETINEFWKSLPAKRRQISEIAQVKFHALMKLEKHDLAYQIVEEQVHRGLDTRWALTLAQMTDVNWQARYNLLTKYMGNRTEDTNVLKAQGVLLQQGGDNAQALEFLHKAVALDPKDMKTQILVYELEKELGDMTAEQKLAQIAESEDISIK